MDVEGQVEEKNLESYNAKKRIIYLENMLNKKAYDKKKVSLKKDLESFLTCRSKCLSSATPEDIRLFLIDRDMKGKTKIHDICCPFLGEKRNKDCPCPLRLASGTVASLVSQLKVIFDSFGRKGDYIEVGLSKTGNPVSSVIIRRYLEAVRLEQAVAHVPITQAKPIFLDKLKKINVYITEKMHDHSLKPGKRFVLLRDRAFFTLQFFAGDRASDLGQCLAQEVKKLTVTEGLLFRHTVGKTLGNGKFNEFVISPVNDKLICPIENLNQYVFGAKEMDIDLSVGYLFRTLDPSQSRVLESPVSSSGMSIRLQIYLKELSIFEGETIHGIRGGCAISMMASGIASSKEVMDHVGWFSKSSLDRYSRLSKLVDAGSVSSLFSKVADFNPSDMGNIFQRFGNSSDLPQAFNLQ